MRGCFDGPAATGLWLRDLTPQGAAALVAGPFVAGGPPPLLFTEIRHAGGAIARVDATSSAYGNRKALLSLEVVGLAPTPEIAAALEAHTWTIKDALDGSRTGGVYLNFLEGHEKKTSAASALGAASAERAARLKAAVDPETSSTAAWTWSAPQGQRLGVAIGRMALSSIVSERLAVPSRPRREGS